MSKVTFHKVKGRVIAKFRGGRDTQIIPDKRKYSRKKKMDYEFEAAKLKIEAGEVVEL
jgi:hypothetical protein